MSRRHAARPRLVVDNSSSSDSSTPCSRAKRIKGKCHSPGITSRTDHIPTPLRDMPGSRDARSAGPPKRPTISETKIDSVTDVSIGADEATNGGQSQAPIVANLENGRGLYLIDHHPLPDHKSKMTDQAADHISKYMTQAIREMMGRIRDLRIGETDVTPFSGTKTSQEDFVKAFCESDEFGQKAYGEWERGRTPPPIYAIINFAAKYNLSLDYLMRNLGLPQPPHIFQLPGEPATSRADKKAKPRKSKKREAG